MPMRMAAIHSSISRTGPRMWYVRLRVSSFISASSMSPEAMALPTAEMCVSMISPLSVELVPMRLGCASK